VCSIEQRVGEFGRPCLPWKQEIGGSNPPTLTTTDKFEQERFMSDIKVYGEHEPETLAQLQRYMTNGSAVKGVLCADGHLATRIPPAAATPMRTTSPSAVSASTSRAATWRPRLDAHYSDLAPCAKTLLDDIGRAIS
jgi:hypothetical protein